MSTSLSRTAALGTPDAYREFLALTLGGAHIHANLGQTYAEIGDDAGLDYSIRSLVACTRAAVDTLADLKAMKAKQAARRASPSSNHPVMEVDDAR